MAYTGETDANQVGANAYNELLRGLTGVFAANVVQNTDGDIVEIHILAGSSRNPKQIARDVVSALSSAYGLQVDHRLISIAQLKEDPSAVSPTETDAAREIRLRGSRLTQSSDGKSYTASVHLSYRERTFEGEATARDSEPQRLRAVSQAVLTAVHRFLGREDLFTLLSVQKIQTLPAPVYVVVVEAAQRGESVLLVGAAAERAGEALSVERATLDALNRTLPTLTLESTEG